MASVWRRFLCLFAQEHPDFRLQELLSIASVSGCDLKYDPTAYSNKNPFLVIYLRSEECAWSILSRAMLIRSIFELWGYGKDYDELEASISQCPTKIMDPYTKTNYTFKVIANGFGKKCTLARQSWIYERLSFLALSGRVNLSNPQHEFHVLEDYGDVPNAAPPDPLRVFLGRLIGHGQRHLIKHYSIKTRHFIGNTSMDAQLSLISANQAKVKPGSLVYDPFVGTGSLLVACAHYGGYVLGADIDPVLLHGRGRSSRAGAANKYRDRGENFRANLQQYGLESQYLDVLVADAAKCVWRPREMFDAIVTDPPYGIREGARKIGTRDQPPKPVPSEYEEGHIPAVCSYRLSDVFADLLEFAARFLAVGGRLVYWLPIGTDEFTEAHLPRHPALKLICHSEQPLQRHIGRKLVTMEKHVSWATNPDQEDSLGLRLSDTSHIQDDFRDKYFKQ